MTVPGPTTRLLVVAGEPSTLDSIRAALAPSECELVVMETADAARLLAARERVDLVLLHLDLAGAVELCEELASPHRFALPVIALARGADPALARVASVCCDVVEHPAPAVLLERRVARALEHQRVTVELEESRTRLARAQRFARLGGFDVEWASGRVRLSEEAQIVFGVDGSGGTTTLDELEAIVASGQRGDWRAWLTEAAAGAAVRPFEHRIFRRDQSERVVRLNAERSLGSRDGSVWLHAIVHDITDRRRVEEELEYQTLHDDLTGLGNRKALLEDLERALEAARNEDREEREEREERAEKNLVAVLFLDLDRFQDVNESLGHAAGDRLLVTVSERLRDSLRERDPLARISAQRPGDAISRPGGDEFALVLSGVGRRDEAAEVAQRVLDALARPFLVDDRELYLTTSIGISLWPVDATTPRELVKNAETAMYHAKERGRATFAFYDPTMDKVAEERLAVQSALRRALERRDLEVWYQPRIELATSRIVGMEALVRWHHPKRGFVQPAQFIPIAEECGLIVPVGNFVLREACAQMRRWHDAGFADLRIAVNVSAEQFRDASLPETVEAIAKEEGLSPTSLELELTESTLMRDVERALAALHRLKAKGVHLSIDDFGTGYSSLAYLKRFPIDCLKIDCSFVRDVTTDAGDAAITAAILFMAHSLKLDVVAEGVETQAQVDFLRCHRCEQVQGYHFSTPLPAAQATALLEKQLALPVEP